MTPTQWGVKTIFTVALTGLLISGWTGVAQTRGGPAPRPTTGSGPYYYWVIKGYGCWT
jgi:hypothetical protein